MIITAVKRPVEINAAYLKEPCVNAARAWLKENGCKFREEPDGFVIETLEGEHLASWGDFIIKGIKGEFYPCKPDIFQETYNITNVQLTEEEKIKTVQYAFLEYFQSNNRKFPQMGFTDMLKAVQNGYTTMRVSQPELHVVLKSNDLNVPALGIRRVLEDGEVGGIYPYVPTNDDINAMDWVVVK